MGKALIACVFAGIVFIDYCCCRAASLAAERDRAARRRARSRDGTENDTV